MGGKRPDDSLLMTLSRLKHKHVRLGLLNGLLVGGVILLLCVGGFFRQISLQLNDTYFVPNNVGDTIVIVGIDDASLQAFGRTPAEWSRTIFADLARFLGDAQARVVALDIIFAETTEDDATLADAMRTARESEARTRFVLPLVGLEHIPQVEGVNFAMHFNTTLPTAPPLQEMADYFGVINTFADVDGVVRRLPSQVYVGDSDPYYTFAIATYLAYLRIPSAAASQFITGSDNRVTIGENISLNVDSLGLWRPNFFGSASTPANATFQYVSLNDVISGQVDPAVFYDRIVMVGIMNSVGLGDRYYVPFRPYSQQMTGVEIHANTVETLLQNLPLTEQSQLSQAVTIMLAALIAAQLYAHLRWQWVIPLAVTLTIAWFVFAFIYFGLRREILSLLYPGLSLLLSAIVQIGIQITDEYRQRRRAEALYAESQRQRSLLETVIAGSPTPTLVLDKDLRLLMSNEAADRGFEVEIGPCQNSPLEAVFQALELSDEVSKALLGYLKAHQPFRQEIKHKKSTLLVEATCSQVEGHWVLVFYDVTPLVQMSEFKTNIIRSASHDLRNPLTQILLYTERVLSMVEQPEAKSRRYLDGIMNASQMMLQIINDLLNLEIAQGGRIPKQPLKLNEIVQTLVKVLEIDLEKRQQVLKVEIEDSLPLFYGNTTQITQCFNNLIVNAIKYTPNGGQITVRMRQEEQTLRFEVEDNGYGIPDSAQSRIFEEFFRAHAQKYDHITGTGMGLSLVRSVVQAHGGKIWFRSKEGEGSLFVIELPAASDLSAVTQE